MDDGTLLLLSARRPVDHHGLFEIDEPKAFAPVLEPGDRLRFSLRANPTVRKRNDQGQRHASRHDVVMDALYPLPGDSRAERRTVAIREEGLQWARQAGRQGRFRDTGGRGSSARGYRQHHIDRGVGKPALSFSSLDFEGVLEVQEPDLLPPAIAHGFGPAKAFGCGLMLIRRL